MPGFEEDREYFQGGQTKAKKLISNKLFLLFVNNCLQIFEQLYEKTLDF